MSQVYSKTPHEKKSKSATIRIALRVAALLLWMAAPSLKASAQSAAQTTALAPSDLARRVDAHYNKLQSLRTGFTEQYDGLGMHRSESGTMMLRKPGRMRWEYASTPGKLFVLDGKYAWFYEPGASQVQRIAASQLDDLRSPLRFLLGHTKIEGELGTLTMKFDKPGTYELSGIPKGQEKRIARLALTVTDAGAITGILIQEVNGAETRFTFTGEQPNAPLPESLFHFAPPAGVPVVDALPPV